MAVIVSALCMVFLAVLASPVWHDYFTRVKKGLPSEFPRTPAHFAMRLMCLIVIPLCLIGMLPFLLLAISQM